MILTKWYHNSTHTNNSTITFIRWNLTLKYKEKIRYCSAKSLTLAILRYIHDEYDIGENGPMSLNMMIRIRRLHKIESDNFQIAKRLLSKKSNMCKKFLDKEYKKHKKYLRMLNKVRSCMSMQANIKKESLSRLPAI